MIPKAINDITEADIRLLVSNGNFEQQTLEFKSELPGKSDRDLAEFRADVTSLANTSGGDLIFGIAAAKGKANSIPGLASFVKDDVTLRLREIIRGCIEPRIPGIEMEEVAIANQDPVLVVRVPKSWQSPHVVKNGETFRVYARDNNGKCLLNWSQITAAVSRAEELPRRMRLWKDDRIATLMGSRPLAPLRPGPAFVLHLVPVNSFANNQKYSVGDFKQHSGLFAPLCRTDCSPRINIDGMICIAGQTRENPLPPAYTQVFRAGMVEAATTEFMATDSDPPHIASEWLINEVSLSLDRLRQGLLKCGVTMPIAVFGAMLGAKGSRPAMGHKFALNANHPIDRDYLELPDILIESKISDSRVELRPLFDGLWNACGWIRCPAYDDQGRYIGFN